MKHFLIIIFTVFSASLMQVQADDLSERQQLMKSLNGYLKILQAQTRDFDGKIVSTQANNVVEALEKVKNLFGEKGTGETKASDSIWLDLGKFEDLFLENIEAAKAIALFGENNDAEGFSSNFRQLAQSCGGCHRNFRERK